jgi:hypothetical protein
MEDVAAAFAFLGLMSWLHSMGYNELDMGWALHRLHLHSVYARQQPKERENVWPYICRSCGANE